jgi:hypothetical protein
MLAGVAMMPSASKAGDMATIANNTNAKLARKESTLIHLSKEIACLALCGS